MYKLHILLLVIWFPLTSYPGEQEYNYKVYNSQNTELTSDFIYAFKQDSNGLLLISTGEGVRFFDGHDFYSLDGDSVLDHSIINIFYKPEEAEKFFLGGNNGVLYLYDNYSIKPLESSFDITSQILDFTKDSHGNIIYLTQNDGIVKVDAYDYSQERYNKNLENIRVTALSYLKDSIVLISTDEGIIQYNYLNGKVTPFGSLPNAHYTLLKKQTDKEDGFLTATNTGHLFLFHFENEQVDIIDMADYLGDFQSNIEDVLQDRKGNVWVATYGDGLYKIPYDDGVYGNVVTINGKNTFPGDFIKYVFEDIENNIWVATYGDGLIKVNKKTFTFYTPKGLKGPVKAIHVVDSISILGSDNYLYVNEQAVSFPFHILSVCQNDRKVWVGTQSGGLYEYDLHNLTKKQVFFKGNSLANVINSVIYSDNKLYLATLNGVYVLDSNYAIENHFTTNNGLFHNVVNHLLKKNNGDIIAATKSKGLYNITQNEIIELSSFHNTDFTGIAEDSRGGFWIATSGDGVLHYFGDRVDQYTVADGLKSNYCQAIIVDSKDRVWIGFQGGLSKIYKTRRISSYGKEDGLDYDFLSNSVFKDKHILYFGTNQGVISYDLKKEDKNITPPKLSIKSIKINDKLYKPEEDIVVPYGKYDVEITYRGVFLREPTSVKYRYMLAGYDDDWSELTSSDYVQYKNLTQGDYIFHLRAVTHEGLTSKLTNTILIRIKKPFWQKPWFLSSSVIFLIFLLYLIIKLRERKQKQKEAMLKVLLEERTGEVVKQKEEIELKNKDITDSINYASRIQSGLMPSREKLKSYFEDSFVLYKPKDIVSGDFYWFTELENGKILVVCADCTGHGVPGSMVSMIGITLLKDICKRDVDVSPAEKLMILDREFEKTLNQNQRKESTNDGMDIILCEFDRRLDHLVFASAMRPLWLYRNKEIIKYKGSNMSIGGYRFSEGENKPFENQMIQLKKKDVIYLFSDGLVDQFGGPNNKKYRPARLEKLLQKSGHYPLLDQLIAIENDFIEWKNSGFQVDDVLLMGLKI